MSPEYVQELKRLGYDGLTPDELAGLRDSGITVDHVSSAVRRFPARAFVDMLKRAAANWWK